MTTLRWAGLLALTSLAACAHAPPPEPPAPAAQPAPVPLPVAPPVPPNIDPGRVPDVVRIPRDTTPVPPPRATAPVTLALTGDINLGTITLPDGLPPDEGRGLLQATDSLLRGDLVIGNFEGAIADSGTPEKCLRRRRGRDPVVRPNCYAFATPARLAARLSEAGFTHLNLANNHANDMGPEGRDNTERTMAALGLDTYGPLGQIAIDTLWRGDSLTIVGLIGFTTYPFAYNLLDEAASVAVVDSLRRAVDVLVVTFHGGDEGAAAVHTPDAPEFLGREARGHLRQWARAVIDAGADAVVGHGPHVLRGIEFYRGKPIAYSLGNFATYRGFNVQGVNGITAVLQLQLGPQGQYQSGRLVPLLQRPRQGPAPDSTGAALRLVRRLSEQDFGPTSARLTDDGHILPPQ